MDLSYFIAAHAVRTQLHPNRSETAVGLIPELRIVAVAVFATKEDAD